MIEAMHQHGAELVSEEPFFAPVSSDLVDSLIGQYQARRAQIDQVVALFAGDVGGVVRYFIEGNKDRGGYSTLSAESVFRGPGAIAALNSDFWSRALAMTDVYNCMPQARRDEWDKAIKDHAAPEFNEETVRATIGDLLAARERFMAERVDGIFRNLSGNHVTNSPTGFNRRMILEYVFNDFGSVQHSRSGTINDLRCVIAKFMGRDEPRWNVSRADLDLCRRNHGEWQVLDGGALRVRAYLKGTAHLEVHPDMAWRLNCMLHALYPRAIPSNHRTKPARAFKTFAMVGRPLPFAVLAILRDARIKGTQLTWGYESRDNKLVFAESMRVLTTIGGVPTDDGVRFDYDPHDAIQQIVLSGCIPDQKSHQFYPSPENVALAAIEMAGIADGMTCLEPSAGQGALAALMPASTLCVEISELHCTILRKKSFNAECADFLAWAAQTNRRFNRIVMNPPFSEGRALAHVEAATRLLASQLTPFGGRLVAILPASMRGKELLAGWRCEWSPVFANEFDGTGVSVAIVAMERT